MFPHFFVNDGGRGLQSGFVPGREPAQVISFHTLEHEMTHYLARFRNLTFGSGPSSRTYDSGEHVPAGSNNVLSLDLVNPLVIPGSDSDIATEKGQIWSRIMSGAWNSCP